MTSERKTTIEVPLSNGRTVIVGDISWDGYETLKEAFLDLLSGQLLNEFSRLLSTPIATAFTEGLFGTKEERDPASLVAESAEAIRDSLPKLVDALRQFMRNMDATFIAACVKSEGFDTSGCTARDMLRLRDACYEINDPAELLSLEKNFLAGVAKSAMRLIGSSLSSRPAGASDGNTNSPEPTAGLAATAAD